MITNVHTHKSPAIHDCLSTANKVFTTLLKLSENPFSFSSPRPSKSSSGCGGIPGERHKSFVGEGPSQWCRATHRLPLELKRAGLPAAAFVPAPLEARRRMDR